MIVYEIDGNIYINLTNKCSNNCTFCVRTTSNFYEEYSLWLEKEPTAQEVINDVLSKLEDHDNFVFCGYGEPLYRLETLIEVASFLKKEGKNVRLNTNGQADLIVGEGVATRLKGLVDTVSISLNADNAENYDAICKCKYGKEGYASLLRFAKECKEIGINTVFSIVDDGKVNVDGAKKVAEEAKIPIRVRQLIK